jgi:hypothetical protein
MEEMRNAYKILVGNPARRSLGRPMYGWEDNIRMGLRRNKVIVGTNASGSG